jgi:hypothetical protein
LKGIAKLGLIGKLMTCNKLSITHSRANKMQTLNIDGTRYTLKFDKCPIAWSKLARKPYKPAKPKDIRKFPKHADLSTADYIKQYDGLNMLQSVQYDKLNV